MGMQKQARYINRGFLRWAKEQGGICCVCRWTKGEFTPADELHHWGDKGTGQKSHDYQVARVCKPCHDRIQGKRRIAFLRTGDMETLAALTTDSLDLLMAYTESMR